MTVTIKDQITNLSDGLTLAIRWYEPEGWTKETSPTDIVLLHEALGCIGMWKNFGEELARQSGRRVLAYDREGYGNSSPLRQERKPDYLHKYAHQELPALLTACGISNPILFGHSDGGSIALLHAAKFTPKAIITEAGHVFVDDVTDAGIIEAVKIWNNTNLSEKLARYHGDKTKAIFSAWADVWQSAPFKKWNIEEDIKPIKCPALIIQGAEDEYGTVEQVESIMSRVSGPVKSSIIPDCKHIPHLQAQEDVLRLTIQFLKEHCD